MDVDVQVVGRGGGRGGRVAGLGDVIVEVEGVGVVVVEVELDWPKPSRRWVWASLFFFLSSLFFPFLAVAPETSSHRLFIDCHECGVTLLSSARRHSLFPVTGERCLLASTNAKRALSSPGVYFLRGDIAKEKAITSSVMDRTKRTYRH